MSIFGSRLREARELAHKSMKDLAEAVGVSIVYISDIERGRRNPPQGDKLTRIANFLGLNPDEVEDLAARDRKRVELELKDDQGAISDAALVLARRWDSITDTQAEEILKIFQPRN